METLPPAPEIPSAFSQSLRSWWSYVGSKQSQISEQRLLHRLPYFSPTSTPPSTHPNPPLNISSSLIQLSNPKHFINTLSILSTSSSSPSSPPPPAIILHGYGAGLGFFFQNLPTLAKWAQSRSSSVYALDWLGMGRSARPPFSIKAKKENIPERVYEAESFFIDSLEDWRQKMNLEKMTLIGHSLGAYFSVVYALRYPQHVHKLILLSPAGVPRGPDYSELSRELTDHGEDGNQPSSPRDTTNIERSTHAKITSIRSSQRSSSPSSSASPPSTTRKIFSYLWESGVSPFQLLRTTMFYAPLLIGKYSSRRFSSLDPTETRDMHDYILNITLSGRGSGEYCISHILEPGAHARMPLVDRIGEIKVPIVFVYGDHDWMDPVGGQQSVRELRKNGNGDGRMYIVNNAGHHVYLDNPKAVNDLLVKELNRTPGSKEEHKHHHYHDFS